MKTQLCPSGSKVKKVSLQLIFATAANSSDIEKEQRAPQKSS